jgi:hypothetical protein
MGRVAVHQFIGATYGTFSTFKLEATYGTFSTFKLGTCGTSVKKQITIF